MRKTLAFVALTALAAGTITATSALAAPDAAQILSANKAASGGAAWNGRTTLKTDYDFSGVGLTGKTHSLSDLTAIRYTDSYQIGPLKGAGGFDGKQAWAKDPSGTVNVEAGGDARALAINDGYRRANLWWKPGFGGAKITDDGEKTKAGTAYDVLSVTPKDGKAFKAWFNAKTHLLNRIVEKHGPVTMITTLSDYRGYDGVKLPHKSVSVAQDGKNKTTQTLIKAAFLPPQPASAYAIPKIKVSDYKIEGGKHETTVPFKLLNNHIYAEAKVNGKGPYQFIFDTGGTNLVTPPTAKALGLKSQGNIQARGAGTNTMKASVTKVKQLQIGHAVVASQPFMVLPLNTMQHVEGVPMPGMVGFQTFRRFVTRIDYGNKKLTLIDPKHFDPKDAGTAIPFTLNGSIPEIKGSFEGIPATWDIDTGSRAGLTLTRPFAEKHGLKAKHPKGIETVDGWGIGGPSTGYVTRGKMLKMGSVAIPNIVTTLANQKHGAFAGSDYSGNVGGGILKRFIVTFDYHNSVMYLKPVKGPVADLDTFDRAGMWINEAPKGFKVVSVTATTPAQAAGLKKGDIITAVNGKPAKEIKLYDLRRHLRDDAPGTVVDFTVLRDGKTKDIKVTLKNLI